MQDKSTFKGSICTFIHFSIVNDIPYHVQIYINQLSLHFEKVIVLTNNKSLQPDYKKLNDNISFWFDENKGYDFGLFYRFYKTHNILECNRLGIVNDSNLLLDALHKVFDWGNKQRVDFWGIIDSLEKPWFSTHENSYHIQSHFIVLNNKAISFLPELFDSIDLNEIFNETDNKKLRRLVINNWEINLSQFFLKKGLSSASFLSTNDYIKKYNLKAKNATTELYSELLKDGYPLLKQRVTRKKSWRRLFKRKELWEDTIEAQTNPEWNAEKIIESVR